MSAKLKSLQHHVCARAQVHMHSENNTSNMMLTFPDTTDMQLVRGVYIPQEIWLND